MVILVKKVATMFPMIVSVILCVLTFSSSALSVFTTETAATENTAQMEELSGGRPLKEYVSSLYSVESVPPSSQSVAVSADKSDAIGKIYEQFLSPYSAKPSYGGVYIKNSTGLTVDIKKELSEELKFKIEKNSQPQVLIVHTHATECYMEQARDFYTSADKSRTTDNEKNVTEIGEIIAKKLESGGIKVIHDRTQHDHPSYNSSYSRAEKTIKEYLNKYPSIKIVVDVHRDSIALTGKDKAKPTVTVNGKKAAQVMLVVGSETGSVTGFPNWRENFRLALKYQQTMEALYPGLARTMTFASRKYNMHLTTGSMLLEVGTDSNSFEEACYSAELAGDALLSLLNTLK